MHIMLRFPEVRLHMCCNLYVSLPQLCMCNAGEEPAVAHTVHHQPEAVALKPAAIPAAPVNPVMAALSRLSAVTVVHPEGHIAAVPQPAVVAVLPAAVIVAPAPHLATSSAHTVAPSSA